MDLLLNTRMCEVVAKDFLDGAIELGHLQEEGITYDFEDQIATVRAQWLENDPLSNDTINHVGRMTGPDGVIDLYEMPIADFVGGVTFALAERGEIPVEYANPQNVARISFNLGRLTCPLGAQTVEVGANG